jgi:hypothetical protein
MLSLDLCCEGVLRSAFLRRVELLVRFFLVAFIDAALGCLEMHALLLNNVNILSQLCGSPAES